MSEWWYLAAGVLSMAGAMVVMTCVFTGKVPLVWSVAVVAGMCAFTWLMTLWSVANFG